MKNNNLKLPKNSLKQKKQIEAEKTSIPDSQYIEWAVECGDPIPGIYHINNKYCSMKENEVYHYTDVNGFISIMKNRELWASHIAFMNDKMEFLHGKGLFIDEINKMIAKSSGEEKQLWVELIENLEGEKSSGFYSRAGKDIFSLSFSCNGDSLEMWRGYGRKSGIAIGFKAEADCLDANMFLVRKDVYDKNHERVETEKQNFSLSKICYNKHEKEKLVKEVIDMGINCYRHNLYKGEDAKKRAIDLLSDMIFYFNPLLKHEGFEGEEECRFIENSSNENVNYDICYRERSGVILPYIKYMVIVNKNGILINEMPVQKIVVGPGLNQSKVLESVKYFLEKNDMGYLVDKVIASDIPYVEN